MIMKENNDGVVTLASQLRQDAQDKALQIPGYDENHVGILANDDVIKKVNQILKSRNGHREVRYLSKR